MASLSKHDLNPELDLILERATALPRALVWRAWTEPKLLEQWFCSLPWRATKAVIDLRPGGEFSCVMRGPNGEEFPNNGSLLYLRHQEELIFTDALLAGFRPSPTPFFTGRILFEDLPGGGTNYTAIGMHQDAAGRKKHAEMGFEQGWGAAFDQLVALMKKFA